MLICLKSIEVFKDIYIKPIKFSVAFDDIEIRHVQFFFLKNQ